MRGTICPTLAGFSKNHGGTRLILVQSSQRGRQLAFSVSSRLRSQASGLASAGAYHAVWSEIYFLFLEIAVFCVFFECFAGQHAVRMESGRDQDRHRVESGWLQEYRLWPVCAPLHNTDEPEPDVPPLSCGFCRSFGLAWFMPFYLLSLWAVLAPSIHYLQLLSILFSRCHH
jgi:hypothetical protein